MRGPWKRSPSFSLVFPHTKPLEVEFLAVELTRFFLLHQEEVFTAKSPNISFQWQLTIFHSYPSVGFSFVLNIAEGATSINLLSNPVPTKNGFVFSPTIMNGIPPFFFGLTLPIITSASFWRERLGIWSHFSFGNVRHESLNHVTLCDIEYLWMKKGSFVQGTQKPKREPSENQDWTERTPSNPVILMWRKCVRVRNISTHIWYPWPRSMDMVTLCLWWDRRLGYI